MSRLACAVVAAAALGGCSFALMHYPSHRSTASVDCNRLKWAPIVDTVGAGLALGTAAAVYNEQTHTSPWPASALVAAVWAAASASYGYYETSRCRSELAPPPE